MYNLYNFEEQSFVIYHGHWSILSSFVHYQYWSVLAFCLVGALLLFQFLLHKVHEAYTDVFRRSKRWNNHEHYFFEKIGQQSPKCVYYESLNMKRRKRKRSDLILWEKLLCH